MIPMIDFSELISVNCDFQGQKRRAFKGLRLKDFVSTVSAARTTVVSEGSLLLLQVDFAGAAESLSIPVCLSHPRARGCCSWQILLNGGRSNSSGAQVNVNIPGYELKQWRLICPIK